MVQAAPYGYDRESLVRALTETKQGWSLNLMGESICAGEASGTILGGCLTLVEATLGTPWELETDGAILVLEDRGMKPHQVDRSLMHFKQAGKFRGVAGIVLGDFPECESAAGGESIKAIALRILEPLGIPVVWGAPVGHTARAMLTIPLGVRARLLANDAGMFRNSGTGRYRVSAVLLGIYEMSLGNSRKAVNHVHLLGIAGSAMAPVAGMLKERGFHVTGSDVNVYPPASTLLDSLGVIWNEGYREENLKPAPDLCVIGNAISRGNAEVEYILDNKIPYCSMPQLLEEYFIPGHTSIVVAGTHGKTTTTAMLAWIFTVAGRQPDFLIGGVAPNFNDRSYGLGGGEEFIIEGDEYDTAFFDKGPKFLHYHPDELILTSLEYDHADIYPNLESIALQFRRLVNLVPRRGRILGMGRICGAKGSRQQGVLHRGNLRPDRRLRLVRRGYSMARRSHRIPCCLQGRRSHSHPNAGRWPA